MATSGNPLYAWEYTCGFCHSVEDDVDLDSLLVCEGGCRRSFHVRCVGMTNVPTTQLKWSCPWCVEKLRHCWLCGLFGTDGGMAKCGHVHCPKQFHVDCLDKLGLQIEAGGVCPFHQCGGPVEMRGSAHEAEGTRKRVNLHSSTAPSSGASSTSSALATPVVSSTSGCVCATAVNENSVFCTKCPVAWCPKCLAKLDGGLVLGDNFGLCPSHRWRLADGRLNSAEVESVNDRPSPPHSISFTRPCPVPFAVPRYVRESPLGGRGLAEHTDESGLSFERIWRNVWVAPRPAKPRGGRNSRGEDGDGEEDKCTCVKGDPCGESCTNRMCFVECNKANCSLGGSCKNRHFSKAQGGTVGTEPKEGGKAYKVAHMGSKGMGLVSKRGIDAGEFVIEYVGEIVTKSEWQERHGNCDTRHFYVMEFSPDLVADATFRGNDARLINHSCDPNARCVKWYVNGEARLGIFANKPIKAGEEITYDYHFETTGNRAFKCLCGTAKCGGWIGKKSGGVEPSVGSDERKKKDFCPVDLLFDFWQEKTRDRNADGTLKTAKDVELEAAGFAAEKIDWYLTYMKDRSQDSPVTAVIESPRGQRRVSAHASSAIAMSSGVARNAAPPRSSDPVGERVFAFLALHIFESELEFIRKRRLFLVRNFSTSRRAWGRRLLQQLSKNELADGLVLANFLSDDRCVRCLKQGLLQWCSVCVKAYHSSCGLSGSRRSGDDWSCSKCVAKLSARSVKRGDVDECLPLESKHSARAQWQRRDEKWRLGLWPRLSLELDGSMSDFSKRRKIRN